MFNLNIIPNPNDIDTTTDNANGAIIAQLIIFYIGVAAFLLVCFIPPFTAFLPIAVPIIVIIIVFLNLSYLGKFVASAFYQIYEYTQSTSDDTDSIVNTVEPV